MQADTYTSVKTHVMRTNTHHPLGYHSTLHALIDARSTWPHRQTRPATDLAVDPWHRWPECSAPPALLSRRCQEQAQTHLAEYTQWEKHFPSS